MNDTAARPSSETYFFRDHGQFDLLRWRLLPELIERRRRVRTLRLWSAGCASGEEAYSLAMLVDMLLPDRNGWDILILGSDIDQAALTKARHGSYRQWSFRLVPPALQQRYFRRENEEWLLEENIRRMVTFRPGDLISDPFPSRELREMDLILCRNVFIYFTAANIAAVATKLAASLSEGGYLVTGHTELIGHRVQNLRSRLVAEGVVYQRLASISPAPAEARPATPDAPTVAAARRVVVVRPPATPSVAELLATARQFADRGDYDRAERTCRQALAATPLSAAPHFLLAQLAQLRGDFAQAEELLDKTLYLDPRCVAAYLELAALCERADRLPRARTLRRAAQEIVRAMPADAVIDPYEMTAAEMAQRLGQ